MTSKQQTLFDEIPDDRLAKLACPACGHRPVDDVLPDGQLPKSMREVERMEPPITYEVALQQFDVLGADDDCVFCPRCTSEFRLDTLTLVELAYDFAGL